MVASDGVTARTVAAAVVVVVVVVVFGGGGAAAAVTGADAGAGAGGAGACAHGSACVSLFRCMLAWGCELRFFVAVGSVSQQKEKSDDPVGTHH